MTETWRPVVGFEGDYEVSDQGRVRSLDRIYAFSRRLNNGVVGSVTRTKRGIILAPGHSCGYLTVRLHSQTYTVHTLVLTAFVGPKPPGMECCHKNGIRDDCRATNLRWDTSTANNEDRRLHGRLPMGSDNHFAKLKENDIQNIRLSNEGNSDLAQKYGVSKTTISNIRSRRTWKHV